MVITIDQGADSPMQEGLSIFHITESSQGWQILPNDPQ